MTTPAPTYARPTVAAIQPPPETFTEVRCPACVPLGWDTSRLLFKVYGVISAGGATIQTRCHRCKSLISWRIGTPELRAIERGPQNEKRRKVAFE
jgi:hypothetical protein